MAKREPTPDEDLMPFGKHQGYRLADVPDHYWRWFRTQKWRFDWPDLLEYAERVREPREPRIHQRNPKRLGSGATRRPRTSARPPGRLPRPKPNTSR